MASRFPTNEKAWPVMQSHEPRHVKSTSDRVSPSGSSASVITRTNSWVSLSSVWRTMGVCAQPTTAMSVEVTMSEDPVHEIGVVHVGFAVGHPADQAPVWIAGGLLRRGRPPRAHPNTDRHVLDRQLHHGLVAEHHVGAVEQNKNPGERVGLGLPRILHRSDDPQ